MNHHLLAEVNIGQQVHLSDTTSLGDEYQSFSPLISSLLRNSLTIAGVIFLFLLLFGGLTLIINAGKGDSKKAGQGKSAITAALIGFAVIILSYSVISLISAITGIPILNPTEEFLNGTSTSTN